MMEWHVAASPNVVVKIVVIVVMMVLVIVVDVVVVILAVVALVIPVTSCLHLNARAHARIASLIPPRHRSLSSPSPTLPPFLLPSHPPFLPPSLPFPASLLFFLPTRSRRPT